MSANCILAVERCVSLEGNSMLGESKSRALDSVAARRRSGDKSNDINMPNVEDEDNKRCRLHLHFSCTEALP